MSYHWTADGLHLGLDWQYRRDNEDIGSGEIPADSFQIVDLSLEYWLSDHWSLTVNLDNALDELYIPSSDDLDTFATGRNLGIAIHWHAK